MFKKIILLSISLLILLSACAAPESTPVAQNAGVVVTQTEKPEISSVENSDDEQPEQTPTPRPPYEPGSWMTIPIVPAEVSDTVREIYARGQKMGNDPNVFSRIGDCQNVSSRFLGVFDDPEEYHLGEDYAYLQETIDYFEGSFEREGFAVNGGYNVAAILSPLRADKENCEAGESPVACEIRANNPSFVIISLEEWWANKPAEEYEAYLEQIVEYVIDEGVVPILATKADDLQGDNGINEAVARVAYKYDVPLWNFWLAVQPLPNRGLTEDGFHLTFARNVFDDPVRMQSAWPWRNLTALQALDVVRRGATE